MNETWQQELGAFAIPGSAIFRREKFEDKYRHYDHLIIGCTKDGVAIFIFPHLSSRHWVPIHVKKFLLEMGRRGAVVGACSNIGEAFTIVADDPINQKRNKRTFIHDEEREIEPPTDAEPAAQPHQLACEIREPMEES